MSSKSQRDFATALNDREAPLPEGVVAWNDQAPIRRFAVYRNNVTAGLQKAVASRFPVAQKLVGEDFFAAMAHEFITRHPPRSPLLLHYGADFPAFAEHFPPAQSVPYLADVMRLENARIEAYHAEDRAPLDPSRLADVDPETLAELHFTLHPSARLLSSPYPIVTIWAMNSEENGDASLEDWTGESALVIRPQMQVEVMRLPPGGATFLQTLQHGAPLGAAVETAFANHAGFNLTANLTGALQSGVFTDFS
ncbi:DNA-binding domain-containing protein [Allorhizobium sp. BGMRC 0089]|uniref:HvfC/BufC N-terminal domain-containing protein n=1 Tax=Allorhizobium sonneratiae TaxID=2934936 RepID=UPI00203369E7|nr:putative DNA-binding domain-containing protein [Allorhizobium sonneratiae]MCM2291180.1 DNA-binding domain-containing protein [Allorhizobium sonneratiae]